MNNEELKELCAKICEDAGKIISPSYILGEEVHEAGKASCINLARLIRAIKIPTDKDSLTVAAIEKEPKAWFIDDVEIVTNSEGEKNNWIAFGRDVTPFYAEHPSFKALQKVCDKYKMAAEEEAKSADEYKKKVSELKQLNNDDEYAASFQSLGQYRSALLKLFKD